MNDKEIVISIEGKSTDGAIKINLDNYDEKLIDMLYMSEIKKILLQVINGELQGEDKQ